jgi:predicted AlkP superfamily phosphohydrolase/phosphomutase
VRSGRSAFKSDIEWSIDWEHTRAFFVSVPSQGVFINVRREGDGADGRVGSVEPGAEYDQLRALIKEKLLDLRDPRSGEKVMDAVHYREEVYDGPQTQYAPDLIFVARDYSYLGRNLFGSRHVIETSQYMGNGFHRMNGIFMAYGPDIRRGVHVEGAAIVDIAPTVLHLMGLPVPDDMDGRSLTEIMQSGVGAPEIAEATVYQDTLDNTEYSKEEAEYVADRLQALGYLD